MLEKKHFLLIAAGALLLNAAAPEVNSPEMEAEYQRMLGICRAAACPQLPVLLNNLGGIYFSQARYREAEPLFLEAASLNHDDEPLTLSNLAALYRITGRPAQAAPLFDRAIRMLEQKSPNGPELPRILTGAAMLALETRAGVKDAVQGEARSRQALALLPADSLEAATAHNTLGTILEISGRYSEAQSELETALGIRERLLGADHPLVAETLNKLGLVYRQEDRLVDAETLYHRAIAILRSRPPVTELGTALNNLGNTLAARGQIEEAESSLREAISVWEGLLGPEHTNIAAALSNLSTLERTRHHYAEAELLLAKALAMDRKLLPAGSVRIGLDLNNAGALMATRKHYQDAEGAFRDSLSILQEGLPPDHPEVGRVLVNLAEVLRLEHKTQEAEVRYRDGLKILKRAWGPEDTRLLAWLEPYATVLRSHEDFAEAAKADMEAMKIRVLNRRYERLSSSVLPNESKGQN